jgi:hypothetical protein
MRRLDRYPDKELREPGTPSPAACALADAYLTG